MKSNDLEPSSQRCKQLVVVGAAAGIGRWLCDNLFRHSRWEGVLLIDVEPSSSLLVDRDWGFEVNPQFAVVVEAPGGHNHLVDPISRQSVAAPEDPALVCLAIPQIRISEVAEWLIPALHVESVVFETSPSKSYSQVVLSGIAGGRPYFGIHPLFDSSAQSLDGQTIFITPPTDLQDEACYQQLADLIVEQGGTYRVGTPEHHDYLMSFVQTLAHRSLINLLDSLINFRNRLAGDLGSQNATLRNSLWLEYPSNCPR